MSDDLTSIEEQALDALLLEVLGKAKPPDLSRQILVQLSKPRTGDQSIVRGTDRESVNPVTVSADRKRILVAMMIVATLAASLAAAIWLRPDHGLESVPNLIAGNTSKPASPGPGITADPSPRVDAADPELAVAPRKKRQGIPLVIDSPRASKNAAPPNPMPREPAPVELRPPLAVTLVAKLVDSDLRDYWDAIGVRPTEDASGEEIAIRLAHKLGVDLPVDSVPHADRLPAELRQPAVARVIARRWLDQVSEGGLARVEAAARDSLVDELAACFASGAGFDQSLSDWIGGKSANSTAFYSVVSGGSKQPTDGDLVRRLASLTLNADLRCIRCHDAYIERTGRQEDYWSFTALIRRDVNNVDGTWTVGIGNSSKPLFYELPDGRQRVADPMIPVSWMKSSGRQPIEGVAVWAQSLVGAPELARGVVNSLWQLVHDRPLRGRVVDPLSPPLSEALGDLEDRLSEDLIRSQFDVTRTLALIIASPATQRAVPAALQNAWATDTSKAREAAGAFAAALPSRPRLSMGQRMDETMRSIGAKLDANGKPVLAQIGATGSKPGNNVSRSGLSWDFPINADSLPVQWLGSIADKESRIEHLCYLSGKLQIPTTVQDAAEAMRAAGVSEEQMLHRIWWLIRP